MTPNELTPDKVKEILEEMGYVESTLDALENLGAIKTLSFNDHIGYRDKSVDILDSFVIKPIRLFEKQNVLMPSENISKELSAEIRVALTNDLEHYYIWNGDFVEIENINEGLPITRLPDIDLTHWEGDMGLAISIEEKSADRKLEVNDLFFILNGNVPVIANGTYKITYGTLLETDVQDVREISDEDIDAMFT